jgi:hypothetical protein
VKLVTIVGSRQRAALLVDMSSSDCMLREWRAILKHTRNTSTMRVCSGAID